MVVRVATPDRTNDLGTVRSLTARLKPHVAVRPAVAWFVVASLLYWLALMQAAYWITTW